MPTKTKIEKRVSNHVKTRKKAVTKKLDTQIKSQSAEKKLVSNSFKPTGRTRNTTTHKKTTPKEVAVTEKANAKTKKLLNKLVEEPTESNLPLVEEKSPVINNPNIVAPGREKSIQRAAVRNYVKKQIRLSGKKCETKPAGKKPLW